MQGSHLWRVMRVLCQKVAAEKGGVANVIQSLSPARWFGQKWG
jgi:hypothetical protein